MNIIKHFFTIGISSIVNMLLGVITTPIITRIVEPDIYGKYIVFNTYIGIIAAFVYFGLNEALLRFFYEYDTKEEKTGLLKLCFVIPLFAALILSFFAIILFLSDILKFEIDLKIFIFLCINVILAVWNCISTEMLQNIQKSSMYSLASVMQKAVYCFCSIIAIVLIKENYLLILVISTAFSVLVSALVGTYVTREYWSFKNVSFPQNSGEIMKYSLPSYIFFVIYSIYDTANNIIVEKLCNDYEVGIYGSAFSLVGIFAIVQTAFTIVWRPIQTEHFTVNPKDTSFISKGNRYITLLMIFAGINIILLKDGLCLLLGEAYRAGSCVIPFLVFNPIMNTMIGTVTSGIEKSKKSIYKIVIIVIAVTVLFGLDYLLIPKYGAIGAAIAGSISLIIQYYITEYYSNKFYSIDYGTKKSVIMIIVLLINAYLNTFHDSIVIVVSSYISTMLVYIKLYFNDLEDIYYLLLSLLKKK